MGKHAATSRVVESSQEKEEAPKITLRYYDGGLQNLLGRSWFGELLKKRRAGPWIIKFWMLTMSHDPTHAVLAWQKGTIVGLWAVRAYSGGYASCGTYVVSRLRRQRLGTRMWCFLTKRLVEKRPELDASAVTKSGRGFLYHMRLEHDVDFDVNV